MRPILRIHCVFLFIFNVVCAYDEWAIHIPKGRTAAQEFARDHGLELVAEIIPDSNHFQFIQRHSRMKRSAHEITKKILSSKDAAWAAKQETLSRVKRDNVNSYYRVRVVPRCQWTRMHFCKLLQLFLQADMHKEVSATVNDPYWDDMWYLNRKNGMHMNVDSAWDMGISGEGVAVTILDDGIEKDHPDLLRNYDPLSSTDINDNDSDPNPRYDFSDSNRHGTRCAGQVRDQSLEVKNNVFALTLTTIFCFVCVL